MSLPQALNARAHSSTRRREGAGQGQSGAVVVVQRTSSDLKLNPHLHAVFLDGVYRLEGEHVLFHALPHLTTREVAEVLARVSARIGRYVRRQSRRAELGAREEEDEEENGATLAASAVSGSAPPAGPEWRRGALPLVSAPVAYEKPLCASLINGFTLHAATRAGAMDAAGREALVKYVLRPPIAASA